MLTKQREAPRPSDLDVWAFKIRAESLSVASALTRIGGFLTEAKRACGHGQWLGWLEREFQWTPRYAQQLMAVHRRLAPVAGDDGELPERLAPGALYVMARPDTPDEVVDELLERAAAGEDIGRGEATAAVERSGEPDEVLDPEEEEPEPEPELEPIIPPPRTPAQVAKSKWPTGVSETLLEDERRWKDERYTPEPIIAAAAAHMGTIHLDPASSELANLRVCADRFFDVDDDGLAQDWCQPNRAPANVFLNMPYSKESGGEREWLRHCVVEQGTGRAKQAWVVMNNDSSRSWFVEDGYDANLARCEIVGRQKFSNPLPGMNNGSTMWPTVVLYVGTDIAGFTERARPLGRVVIPPKAAGLETGIVIPFGADLPLALRGNAQAQLFTAKDSR